MKKITYIVAALVAVASLSACASPNFNPRDTGGGHQGQSDTDHEAH